MKIYIIRHGETNGNLRGVLQGWTDEPLNSKGRKLAQITGKCLASIGFDIAISSPLSRAYETCEIVLRENRNPVPTIQVDDRLKEINFGCWENLGITKKNYQIPNKNFNLFYTNPFLLENSYDGESVYDVCHRTEDIYLELVSKPQYRDRNILLTTHGFALRCLLRQVYEDKTDFWHGKIPDNCAVNIIDVVDGKGTLIGDDLIYYDKTLAVNPYTPI